MSRTLGTTSRTSGPTARTPAPSTPTGGPTRGSHTDRNQSTYTRNNPHLHKNHCLQTARKRKTQKGRDGKNSPSQEKDPPPLPCDRSAPHSATTPPEHHLTKRQRGSKDPSKRRHSHPPPTTAHPKYNARRSAHLPGVNLNNTQKPSGRKKSNKSKRHPPPRKKSKRSANHSTPRQKRKGTDTNEEHGSIFHEIRETSPHKIDNGEAWAETSPH